MSLPLSYCLLPIEQEAYCIPFTAAMFFTASLSMSIYHRAIPILWLQSLTGTCHQTGLWWRSIDHAEGNGYWVGGNQTFTSPWSQSASVLPSIRQKPPRKYFLHTYFLMCKAVALVLSHRAQRTQLQFLAKFHFELSAKGKWKKVVLVVSIFWPVLLSKSNLLLRSGEKVMLMLEVSITPFHLCKPHTSWGRLQTC